MEISKKFNQNIFLVIFLLIIPFTSYSQNLNTSLISILPYGHCYALDKSSNLIAFGIGDYLQIADISNLDSVVALGRIQVGGNIIDIIIEGNIVYTINSQNGLDIIDISNTMQPEIVGNFDTPGLATGIDLQDSLLFIADDHQGVRVIDVSSPTAPEEITSYEDIGKATDIKIKNEFAYIATSDSGIIALDISIPTDEILVSKLKNNLQIKSLSITDSLLFYCNMSVSKIVSIRNPDSLFIIGSFGEGGFYEHVFSQDTMMFISSSEYGIQIIGVSDPENPKLITTYDTETAVRSSKCFNQYLYYAADNGGLGVLDISNPSSPDSIFTYYTDGEAHDIKLSENYAFIADDNHGLKVVDISDIDNPHMVARFKDNIGFAKSVELKDNLAYISDSDFNYTIRVIDFSDITNLWQMGYFGTGRGLGLDLNNNYAYVAGDHSGLYIFDISNFNSQTHIGHLDTEGNANNVIVNGNYAYVADVDSGLRVVDISNPAEPVEVGSFINGYRVWDVKIRDNLAFIANHENGLRIIDVSNPNNPNELGYWKNDLLAYNVTVDDRFAYVGTRYSGLQIIDISNIHNPINVAYYETNDRVNAVAVRSDTLFIACNEDGIYIIRNDYMATSIGSQITLPKSIHLKSNYPNPFNNNTIIEYYLPDNSIVTIDIYDVLGQKVKNLLNTYQYSGAHKLMWDGTSSSGQIVSSGIYILVFQAGDFYSKSKMLLLK